MIYTKCLIMEFYSFDFVNAQTLCFFFFLKRNSAIYNMADVIAFSFNHSAVRQPRLSQRQSKHPYLERVDELSFYRLGNKGVTRYFTACCLW